MIEPPTEAPPPPAPSLEEISNSQLMPDDSGAALAFEAEELSGSVLVEDPAEGQGPPVVTRLYDPRQAQPEEPISQPAAPAEPAHRALLGMPQLPRSTPAPMLERMPQPTVVIAEHPSAPGRDAPAGEAGQDFGTAEGEPAYAPATPDHVGSAPPPAMSDDVEVYEVPKRGLDATVVRSKALLRRVRAALLASAEERPGRRPQWMLPAVTVAGLFVGVGLAGILFSLGGHRGPEAVPSPPSAQASTHAAPSSVPATRPSATAAPATPVTACMIAGATHVVAPTALVAAGVEVRPFGDGVALGFAPTDHEAVAVRLDATSLATTGSVGARSTESIRRVRPIVSSKDALGVMVDADRKHDPVRGRRTLPLDPPLQIGMAGSDLVWTRSGGPPAGKLWTLDNADDVDALRAASEGAPGDTTTAIAFRRGGAIWIGTATGYKTLAAKGDLSRIGGLGTAIGSPAVAISDGVIMLAWADRASPDVPWRLRITHMKAGDPAGEPVNFSPPTGGPGGHVMSPGLAAVPGGRFLLVWTEGPTSKQRVRGITLSSSGEPAGKPLEISNEAVNSGQGQAAITATPAAKGVVAFLQAAGDGFEVAATSIACGS